MASMKLKFFDFMGVAEPIRYLLAYGGMKYENIVIQKGPNWDNMKKSIPFGKLPVFEVNDKILYQSVAICQYLAKLVHIIPNEDLEIAEMEAISLSIYDFSASVYEWYHMVDVEMKQELQKELEEEVVPRYLGDLEFMAHKHGGYLSGKKMSWVDLYFVGIMESVQGMMDRDWLQQQYPQLYQIFVDVHKIPAIKNYIAHRPSYKY